MDEFKAAQIQRDLEHALLHVRDRLQPIADGEIRKGKRDSRYDRECAMRKTTLKDAREIATCLIGYINYELNKEQCR